MTTNAEEYEKQQVLQDRWSINLSAQMRKEDEDELRRRIEEEASANNLNFNFSRGRGTVHTNPSDL